MFPHGNVGRIKVKITHYYNFPKSFVETPFSISSIGGLLFQLFLEVTVKQENVANLIINIIFCTLAKGYLGKTFYPDKPQLN